MGKSKNSEDEKTAEAKKDLDKDKVEQLTKALKEEQDKVCDYLNRLKYLQADFDNYRKMMKKKMNEIAKFGSEQLIVKLLTILDELELAVNTGKKTEDKKSLINGVEIVLRNFKEILRQEGLTEIEALGKPLNPEQHEATETVQTTQYPNNTIIEEIRKGYILNGKVIRPSIVKIVKNTQIEEKKPQLFQPLINKE
jgi:molecular chaperone GrpE